MPKTKNEKICIRPYTRQFYKGNVFWFTLALISALLTVVLNLIASWLLQQVLDLISSDMVKFTLGELALIGLTCIGGICFCGFLDYHALSRFVSRGISQYKNRLFDELTKKNVSAFYKENSATYISALTNDMQTIEQGYLNNVFAIFTNLLFFFGAFAMMLCYNPLLTLIAIGFSLFPLFVAIFTGNKMATAEKSVSEKNENYTASLKDALTGFAVIKSFKAEAQMIRIFQQNVNEVKNAQCKKRKIRAIVDACAAAASVIAQFGVFGVGAYMALSGKGVTAGTIIIFIQLMNYVIGPIATLPTCFAERKAAKALVEKIAVSLEENAQTENDFSLKTISGGISLKEVSFSYTPQKQVLNRINYDFATGKKYAIVGASGSGKSTLLNLLMSAHQDYTGEIYYGENELKEIAPECLYEHVGIIQQNVFVFNATIRENVTMFKEFPQEEIDKAIERSGLSALIKEKGASYLCGENGNALSGGEKQRISIARSLLKQSKILLVDEATSALDKETAYQVTDAILGLKDITAIVVTHSLDESLLKKYDGILMLKNGTIIEEGRFDELIEKKGYFYSLFTISQ